MPSTCDLLKIFKRCIHEKSADWYSANFVSGTEREYLSQFNTDGNDVQSWVDKPSVTLRFFFLTKVTTK